MLAPLTRLIARSLRPSRHAALLAALAGLSLSTMAFAQPRDNQSDRQPTSAAGTGRAPAARDRAAAAPDLPITRITLYRSGVGYFQRTGTISGDSQVSLKFDTSQINDVLKSLQVLDFGGRVASVGYPSKDPLARRLGSFSLQIGDNPSLPQLLERLRGSGVALTTADGVVSGSVLSVEMRDIPQFGEGGKSILVKTPVVNIVTATGIRSVAVPTITNFTLSDQTLADELNKALSALAESRGDRQKTVDVTLNGTGERRLAMAYVHETPVWKTSYRLVLPDTDDKLDEAARDGGKPRDPNDKSAVGDGRDAPRGKGVLQGWAIVENTTDSDWSNVRLSLVSGRPVSFRMDLYEPLYVFRPEVPVPTVPGVMPRAYEGGLVNPAEAGSFLTPASAAPMSPPAPGRADGGQGAAFRMNSRKSESRELSRSGVVGDSATYLFGDIPITASDMINQAAQAAAKGGEIGETFQFELENPVTIERQRSAMIPLLTANVAAQRVSIFNLADRADHPMRGVELTNSTDLQLLPGPLSVLDGPSYAGDAQINQVSPGDKRLLAYAVDLDVAVTTEPMVTGQIVKLRIVNGSLEQTLKSSVGVKYTFANKDLKRPRNMIIEHPKFDGHTLVSALKPRETTQNLYRFPATIAAGQTEKFEISQERVESQTIGIMNYDLDALLRFRQSGQISESVLTTLRAVFAAQAEVQRLERAIDEGEKRLVVLRQDQTRITGVMQPLDRNSDTYRNFLTKLNKQEAEIDKRTGEIEKARTDLETARAKVNTMVANVTVE